MGAWDRERPFRPAPGPVRKALGWLLAGLWWLLRALVRLLLALLLGGGVLGGSTLLVVLLVLVRAAFASIFVWLGWNHGVAVMTAQAQVPWTTAFWCSVAVAGVALPFASHSSAKAKKETA